MTAPTVEEAGPRQPVALSTRKDEDGQTLHPSLDAERIDEAVRFINRKTILSGLDLAREVGKYILDHFFDGDFQSFTNPSSTKERSFRALLAREDLLLGNTTLYNFVRVSHQLEQLPPDVVDSLSLAQHRALLPLPDPERKEELARRALAEGWTSHVLADQVSELLPKSRRGRKPSPPFAKAIRRVAKALAAPRAEELKADEVRSLGRQRAVALAEQLQESLDRLEALKEAPDETCTRIWPES